jgi:hypothetical protein
MKTPLTRVGQVGQSLICASNFLKDNIDLASPFMGVASGTGQVFTTDMAGIDGSNRYGLNATTILDRPFYFSLTFTLVPQEV